jgi:hypothetical protein
VLREEGQRYDVQRQRLQVGLRFDDRSHHLRDFRRLRPRGRLHAERDLVHGLLLSNSIGELRSARGEPDGIVLRYRFQLR